MHSSGIETFTVSDNENPDGLLPAVCLLPEPTSDPTASTAKVRGVQAQLEAALLTFGDRFQRCYYLTTRYGLFPHDQALRPSEQRFEDVEHEARHRLLMLIEGQLKLAAAPNLPIVCMVGGRFVQGLRRLRMPMITPLASMSMYQRRFFIDMCNRATLGEVAGFVLGPAAVPLSAVTPAIQAWELVPDPDTATGFRRGQLGGELAAGGA